MKIRCDREKFLAAYQTVSSVVPARSPKPILQNVKLDVDADKAVLTATDLEIGVRFEVPGVEVDAAGSAVLQASRFGSILREMSDATLEIEADAHGTTVRGQRSRFSLPGEDPREFPAVAAFTEQQYHVVAARVLRELIRRTVFATDAESTRYALGGVLFEIESDKITAVGTDGRRLARMQGAAQAVGEPSYAAEAMPIVPAKAMHFMERALVSESGDVSLAATANSVLLKGERITIFSRLVEGRFPKWRDVFPRQEQGAKIPVVIGTFHGAVRQSAIVTDDDSRGVDFSFNDGKVTLTGRAPKWGESHVELPIPYDGPAVSITLDPRYLVDFLRVLDQEKTFTLEVRGAESAAVCSTDDGYGYVIMPLARDHG